MEGKLLSYPDSTAQIYSDYRLASAYHTKPVSPPTNVVSFKSGPGSLQARRRRHHVSCASGFADLRGIIILSICSLLWCSPCIAAAISIEDMDLTTAAAYSEIIFDRSLPPAPHDRLINKRANGASTSSTRSTDASTTATSSTSSALPSAFDSSLGNNFTASSCPQFFQSFLSNSTFNECLPLSLLLQTSTSFFAVEQSPFRLAQTLEASCNVDFAVCSSVMASLARQIQMPSNCGADLQAENPTVLQAFHGLAAYQTVYHAGCLQDGDTGNYCFSDAVTNASSPSSSYIYFTALGVALPSATDPNCNTCLQNTMAVFAGAATNKSQPIAGVYGDAARLVESHCGANFVNTTVSRGSGASGSSTSAALRTFDASHNWFGLFALVAVVLATL